MRRTAPIRADGRMIHDMFLYEVKAPERIEVPVGLLQADGDGTRRPSVPPAVEVAVLAGQEVLTDDGRARDDRMSATASVVDAQRPRPRRESSEHGFMTEIFGIPAAGACWGSCCSGWSTGRSTRCCRSGLAVIFGLLGIVNFAHGALYMMGAYRRVDPARSDSASNYWWALVHLAADHRHRSASSSSACSSSGSTSSIRSTDCC